MGLGFEPQRNHKSGLIERLIHFLFYITELSLVAQERAEGPKAHSPGQRPGYISSQQGAL